MAARLLQRLRGHTGNHRTRYQSTGQEATQVKNRKDQIEQFIDGEEGLAAAWGGGGLVTILLVVLLLILIF